MSRQTSLQRWSSLVLLATLVSLTLFYTMPAMVFRAGRAWEAGRLSATIAESSRAVAAAHREQTERVRRLSERVSQAVVRIEAWHDPSVSSERAIAVECTSDPATERRIARGCGIVIGPDGHLVTSYETVANAREIHVHVPRCTRPCSARWIGGDPDTNLAVLQLEPPLPDLTIAALSQGAVPRVGDRVIAIGNADRSEHSLWVGAIHAEGRSAAAAGCLPLDFIRTPAVNSLNRGGPLLNLRGEVIGISAASSRAHEQSELAIPADIAIQVISLLCETGRVERGWLGIFLHRADGPANAKAATYALDYVVPDSPSARAGLRAGDLIVRVNGRTFADARELRRWIAVKSPSTELALSLIRDDEPIELQVVVEPRPDSPPLLPGEAEWGVRVLCHFALDERRRLGLGSDGVVIQAVSPAAQAAGVRPWDAIVEVNGMPTLCLNQFCREVQCWRESSAGVARLTVCARGEIRRIELQRQSAVARSASH